MSNSIKLAILGLGTVGTGVITLINDNLDELKRRSGRDIIITEVGTRRQRDDIDENIIQNSDLMAIAASDNVDIVIEVIGGTTLAKDVIMHAIKNGKHVVTANKALLAEHGNEIFAFAEANNVHVAYEAAVAGGIPIIKVMREALAANKIDWLAGIINGTGNFIMTEMRDKGRSFADVLNEAQELGYAEADPTFDVEGIDAAHKLALLASIAFGIPLQFDKVYCEGITGITLQDVNYAEELGYRIKHLGFAVRRDGQGDNNAAGIELRVHPTLIPQDALLANVNGVKNAVLVNSHPLGQTLYCGDGAGAGATASAVMADVMDLVRVLGSKDGDDQSNIGHHVPHLAFIPEQLSDTPILRAEQMTTGYYLRVHANDNPGVLADITRILSDAGINIDAILQKPAHKVGQVPVIILTLPVVESQMNLAIEKIEKLETITDKVVRIRLDELA
ncbi:MULTISPECIES: homoserine dehydrogenase [unclassified Psychrobacter]|uniref:homoserine dehydrogenase n=1 Tax=unclassified Psychrobacter TaxID=196806 RepID=UPI0025B4EF29|nr:MULTISPECIES: homoserine dehydrogenase [unclassified Psychrobacter]MDN3453772.1 homoserine dehydrogenase [Psychrobacter sp. APC 3350]MDN3501283.1 homoserine dehydrogenase [Psychrobacter sp. 5A.1]